MTKLVGVLNFRDIGTGIWELVTASNEKYRLFYDKNNELLHSKFMSFFDEKVTLTATVQELDVMSIDNDNLPKYLVTDLKL